MNVYESKAVTSDNIEIDADAVPDINNRLMARMALNAIKKMFEDPVIQAKFEEWKADRIARGIQDT